MDAVKDTNLVAHGGLEGQRWAAGEAACMLVGGRFPSRREVELLDREMIRRNLSPGGCADLLAITYLLYFLQEMDNSDGGSAA